MLFIKRCPKCGEKDLTKFYKTSCYCRSCQREATRNTRLAKLGMTRKEYLDILHGQLGACAICKDQEKPVQGTQRGLHMDHDHVTGKRRGILCSRCNQVLGRCKEDIALLKSMIAYIEQHK